MGLNKKMENIFYVGKYAIPDDGVIPLPKTTIQVMNKYIGIGKFSNVIKDDRITLVIKDYDFWPVICKFDDDEVMELINMLIRSLRNREKDNQIVEELK